MVEKKYPTFQEVKALEGKKKEEVLEVDKSLLRAINECIGDTNPRFQLNASPSFFITVMLSGGAPKLNIPFPYKRGVAAGADWDFHKPVKVGDVITTTHEFAELQDKSSEKGPRALIIFRSTHKNQKGEVVAISTNSVMSY